MNAREKDTVSKMIRLYCRAKHGRRGRGWRQLHGRPWRHGRRVALCPDCRALEKYAHERLEHCPFGEEKPACKRCKVHCYSPQQREKIRKVMRFAGPRMLFVHPLATIRHLLRG